MNRRLTPAELTKANNVLSLVRDRIASLSEGDPSLRFAYTRKIAKELVYDERRKPVYRIRLKAQKRKEQQGRCALCRQPLVSVARILTL